MSFIEVELEVRKVTFCIGRYLFFIIINLNPINN